jgi:hypothetical protein
MFSKVEIIELSHIDDLVNWEVISDFHEGNKNHQRQLAESCRKRILDDPYRFTSLGGDQLDLILPGDPRWKFESVEDRLASKSSQMDSFDEFWAELFEEQKRYKSEFGFDKVWYEQWGNHEYKSRVMEEGEMKRWCKDHGTTFLGSKGFLHLDIRYKNKSKMKKTLFVNHGAGSGDAKRALENLTVNVEADVYQMGHLHQPMGIESEILYFNQKKMKWDAKPQLLINSGCFTTGIRDGVDQWFDQRNKLKTSKPGTVTVTFDSYNDKMNYHM